MLIKSQAGKESVLVYSVLVVITESSNYSEYAYTFGVHCASGKCLVWLPW